mmetsp:Transcript_100938/g.253027  ORF Transcript_100938/g.253027 Transcript_100938/m.253027 type:complete len:884 (-) Transcript_100938:27-2678(-)
MACATADEVQRIIEVLPVEDELSSLSDGESSVADTIVLPVPLPESSVATRPVAQSSVAGVASVLEQPSGGLADGQGSDAAGAAQVTAPVQDEDKPALQPTTTEAVPASSPTGSQASGGAASPDDAARSAASPAASLSGAGNEVSPPASLAAEKSPVVPRLVLKTATEWANNGEAPPLDSASGELGWDCERHIDRLVSSRLTGRGRQAGRHAVRGSGPGANANMPLASARLTARIATERKAMAAAAAAAGLPPGSVPPLSHRDVLNSARGIGPAPGIMGASMAALWPGPLPRVVDSYHSSIEGRVLSLIEGCQTKADGVISDIGECEACKSAEELHVPILVPDTESYRHPGLDSPPLSPLRGETLESVRRAQADAQNDWCDIIAPAAVKEEPWSGPWWLQDQRPDENLRLKRRTALNAQRCLQSSTAKLLGAAPPPKRSRTRSKSPRATPASSTAPPPEKEKEKEEKADGEKGAEPDGGTTSGGSGDTKADGGAAAEKAADAADGGDGGQEAPAAATEQQQDTGIFGSFAAGFFGLFRRTPEPEAEGADDKSAVGSEVSATSPKSEKGKKSSGKGGRPDSRGPGGKADGKGAKGDGKGGKKGKGKGAKGEGKKGAAGKEGEPPLSARGPPPKAGGASAADGTSIASGESSGKGSTATSAAKASAGSVLGASASGSKGGAAAALAAKGKMKGKGKGAKGKGPGDSKSVLGASTPSGSAAAAALGGMAKAKAQSQPPSSARGPAPGAQQRASSGGPAGSQQRAGSGSPGSARGTASVLGANAPKSGSAAAAALAGKGKGKSPGAQAKAGGKGTGAQAKSPGAAARSASGSPGPGSKGKGKGKAGSKDGKSVIGGLNSSSAASAVLGAKGKGGRPPSRGPPPGRTSG